MKVPALFLLFLISTGLSAQINKPLTKTDRDVFNKTEPEYVQVQNALKQLDLKRNELLVMMKAYEDQQKTVTEQVEKLERRYISLNGTGKTIPGDDLKATQQMQETQKASSSISDKLQNTIRLIYEAIGKILEKQHALAKDKVAGLQ